MKRNMAAFKRLVHRRTKRTIAPYMADRTLADKILALRPLAFWPLWEPAGTTGANSVRDISGYNRHGTPTAVTFGAAGIDGRTAGYFGGTSYIDIYSAALNAAWNGQLFSILAWMKVSASVWTDGLYHRLVKLHVDSNNTTNLVLHSNNNSVQFYYKAGGTTNSTIIGSQSSTDWISYGISVNKAQNRVRNIINGVQVGADVTGLGTWVGVLDNTQCLIGADTFTPTLTHAMLGTEQYVTLFNRELTANEWLSCGRL